MNCTHCGSLLTENDQFCKNCGASRVAPANQGGGAVTPQQPVNQPGVMPQQPTNNQYSVLPQGSTQPKSGGSAKYIVICIIAIAAIVAGVYVFNSLKGSGGSGGSGGDPVVPVNQKTYKINFKGFTFSIPDDLVYEIDGNVLAIGDASGSWIAQMGIQEGQFEIIKQHVTDVPAELQKMGLTSTTAKIETLGDCEYVTSEISYNGNKGIYAFAKLNSMYFIKIIVNNKDNEYDYDILKTVGPIVNSAEQTEAMNQISSGIKMDDNSFADIAK